MRAHHDRDETAVKYLLWIREHRDGILRLYQQFEGKKPILHFEVQEERVYAYPYKDYKKGLSKKSRGSFERQYRSAHRSGMFVLLVRDSKRKRCLSFSFPSAPEQELGFSWT